jgi:hypothetical protein
MTVFDNVIPAIARCAGYTINLVSYKVIEEADALEIGFRWGPGRPDIILSMQGVHHFVLGGSPGKDLRYVDAITATPLPAGEPLPPGLAIAAGPGADLPALLWIRAEPAQLEVVAATVTVLQEPG